MALLVDVHCHLEHPDFAKDIDEVIERAEQAGVGSIITAGVNPETNRAALALAKRFPIVKASLGIYPPDALQKEMSMQEFPGNSNKFDVDQELEFIHKNFGNIMAIGEAGLDYKSGDNRQEQRAVFGKVIALAEKTNKPLVVHSRKAEGDVVEMLESSRLKKVMMHCFSGKHSLVKRIETKGWYLSIPTNIARSEQFQSIVRNVDLSRLLTETDAPYLSPFKGQRNEPVFVAETIKKIAEIKEMTLEEVENNIYFNYERLFL